jgi:CHAT domain-containing protein/tetratricopeptide (TPR) repeat protein
MPQLAFALISGGRQMCGRFRTAIGVCGVLLAAPLHVGCREQGRSEQGTPSEPAGEQETRSPAPIQSTPFTEPTWLPEEPAWWTDLSVDGREEISRADGRVDQAYGLWREGKLTKAMQEIEAALKAYQKLLGKHHWKTWDCELDLCWLRAELKGLNKREFAKLGVPNMLAIPSRLDEISIGKDGKLKRERQMIAAVGDICDRVHETVGTQYPLLSSIYRQWALGNIAVHKREWAQAKQHYGLALQDLEALTPSDNPWEVVPRNRLVRVLLLSGDTEHAWEHITASLRTLAKTTPPRGEYFFHWQDTLYLASLVSRIESRYGEAKTAARMLVTLCREVPEGESELASHLLDIAGVCSEIGEDDTALAYLDEIRTTLPHALEDQRVKIRFLEELGFAYLRRRAFDQACEHFRQRLEMPGCDGSETARCWRARFYYGIALTKRGQYEDAVEQFELSAFGASDPRSRSLCRLMEMRARAFAAAWQNDRGKLEGLAADIEDLADLDDTSECRRHRLLAYIFALLQQNRRAGNSYTKADEHYKSSRSSMGLNALELAYWHEHESPYLLAALCRIRLGNPIAALEQLEKHSGQALTRLLTPPASVQCARSMLVQLGVDAEPAAVPDSARTGPENQVVQTLAISETMARLLTDNTTAVVGWIEDIPEPGRPRLPDCWAFVVGQWSDDRSQSVHFVEIQPTGDGNLPGKVIRAAAQKDVNWKELAFRLYRERFAPIMPHLNGVERLYILNRGRMLGVPIEMLPVDDPSKHSSPRLLGERFAVAYGPSCSALATLAIEKKGQRADPQRIVVIGDPLSNAKPLPGALATVDAVAVHFRKPTKLIGSDATETALYSMSDGTGPDGPLESCAYILFAGHAFADSMSPRQCGLLMTSGDQAQRGSWIPGLMSYTGAPQAPARPHRDEGRFIDGLLDFREIMGLKLDARLVVLSACDTGLGRELESEGYMGLPHAFFAAGARAMIITLWPVEDYSSAMLVDRFFSNLTDQHMPQAEALREAKEYLRHLSWNGVIEWGKAHNVPQLAAKHPSSLPAYDHPFHWAGYILMGQHD